MVQNRVIKTQIGKTVEDVLDFYLDDYKFIKLRSDKSIIQKLRIKVPKGKN